MNDAMEKRLRESYEELRGLFLELYPGDIAAFDYYLDMLRRSFEARKEPLRALDEARLADPGWYRTGRLLGMMLYVDAFAGNLRGVADKLGYLEECGDMLTQEELKLLPFASLVITSEDGIRFLMDHINGDTYYNIYYPGQNLDRCRTQLALLADMERKLPEIVGILRRICADLGLSVELDEASILGMWRKKAA